MRRQARRESSRAWIASGATVSIKTYAWRYGVDRYTACEDLTAIGSRCRTPPGGGRAGYLRSPARVAPPVRERSWTTTGMMIDGRPCFVAGYTPGGAPYGIYLDEMDDDDLTGMTTPGAPGKLSDLDRSGP